MAQDSELNVKLIPEIASFALVLVIFLVPATLLALLGETIGSYTGHSIEITVVLLLWLVAFAGGLLFKTNPPETYVVITRFGFVDKVITEPGPYWYPLFGSTKAVGPLNDQTVQIYAVEGEEINLPDGSAIIKDGTMTFTIGSDFYPDLLVHHILCWEYMDPDPRARVKKIVNNAVRPRIEVLTVAQASKEAIADVLAIALPIIDSEMLRYGAVPISTSPFRIADIRQSAKGADALDAITVAKNQALAQAEKLQGLNMAILAVMKAAKDVGHEMTYIQAEEQVKYQLGLGAIDGGRLVLVAPGLEKAMELIGSENAAAKKRRTT